MTNEGRQVYEQAQQLPNILQNIEAIVKPTSPSGRVAITLNHDIALKFLLPVLTKFEQKYPEVQLDLILDDAKVNIIEAQIDLAIRIGVPKDESLIARIMHEESMALFASPKYIEQVGQPTTLAALAQCRWLILNQTSHGDTQRFQRDNQTIEIKPQRFSRCNSPLMVQQMTIQGMGVGSLLPTTVRDEIASGKLIRLMPEITGKPLVYPSRRQVPTRTRVLIDYLLAEKIFA